MLTSFNVVLHPALGGVDLGWAVVNVDALPIDSAILMASLEASPLGEAQRHALNVLFDYMATTIC